MSAPGHFELVVAPEAEPVSLVEAKQHARVDSGDDDALLAGLVVAARRYVETACGLALVTQGWRASFDAWDEDGLKLRPHPVQSLDAVRVWTGSMWVEQYAGDFQLRRGRPARVTLVLGTPLAAGPLELEFTAGFDEVPPELKLALLQLVAHWYENREPTAASQNLAVVGSLKHQVDALLAPWRNARLA